MSMAMMAYRVDIEQLVKLLGCQDEARRLEVRKAAMGSLAGRRSKRSKGFSIALSEVIAGPPYASAGSGASGADYGYAFEALCDAHGTSLFNNPVSPFRGGFLDVVDQHLEALGLNIVSRLQYRRLFVKLPEPDDFPMIGHVTRSEVAALVDAFAGKDLATASKALQKNPDLRQGVLEASAMFRDWATEAHANNQGILAFTY